MLGLIDALRYSTFVFLIAIVIGTTCAAALSVWADDNSKPSVIAKAIQLICIGSISIIFFLTILADNETSANVFDSRSKRVVIAVFALLFLFCCSPTIRTDQVVRQRYAHFWLPSFTTAALGAIAGFMIGFPSFGQSAFSQIGAVLFSGAGVYLGFLIMREGKIGKESRQEINSTTAGSLPKWAHSAMFAFVLSGFFTFTASGTWGYAEKGLEYCVEIYGPHVASDSNAMRIESLEPSNKADQLFYEMCSNVMRKHSRNPDS